MSLALVSLLALPSPAWAQDDWGLTRERPRKAAPGPANRSRAPRAPASIEALQGALSRRPNDAAGWARLEHAAVSRAVGVDAAADDVQTQRESAPEHPGVLGVLLARLRERQGDLDAAARLYAEARPTLPDSWVLAMEHARLLQALGQLQRAREVLAQAPPPHGAGRAPWLEQAADVDLALGDIDTARRRHAELAGASAKGAYAAAGFARALARAGRHGLAAREYERLAKARGGDGRASAPLYRDAAQQRLLADEPAGAAEDARAGLRASAANARGLQAEFYVLLTDAARRSGTLEEVADELEQRAGNDAALWRLTARTYGALGRHADAERAYRRWIRLAPREAQARVELAQLLSAQGRLEDAVSEYRALVRAAPDRADLLVELAELLVRLGRGDEARALVSSESRRYASSHPALHRALSELYVRWEMLPQARAELELLTRLQPDEPAHWIALGSLRIEQGDAEGARRAWDHLRLLPGDRADRLSALAAVLADHDQLREALALLEQAREARPEDLELEREYASLLERASRFEQAEAAWRRVLRDGRADDAARKEARAHLVVLWKRSGQLQRQLIELERRFEGPEADREAGRTLIEARLRAGGEELGRAREVLLRLLETEPNDVALLSTLARLHVQLGEPARAVDVLERLIDIDPARAGEHLQRAVELSREAYLDERALSLSKRAAARGDASARVFVALAEQQVQRGELSLAADAFRRALGLEPGLDSAALALGRAEQRLGRARAAHDAFLRVLGAGRDDGDVRRAAAALFHLHSLDASWSELEQSVLPLALARSTRRVYRQLLLDTYSAWLGPSAERVWRGEPRAEDRAVLARVSARGMIPLLQALHDAEPAVRRVAVTLLGAMAAPGAVDALGRLATNDADGALRAEAILALGLSGLPAALSWLREVATGPSQRLRGVATWGIARVASPAAAQTLLQLLGSSATDVRAMAALGLGHQRHRPAIAALAERYAHDPRPAVRAAALHALRAMEAVPNGAPLLADSSAQRPLAEAALLALPRESLAAALPSLSDALARRGVRALGVPPRDGIEALSPPHWPLDVPTYLDALVEDALSASPSWPRAAEALQPALLAAIEAGGQRAREALALLDRGPFEGPLGGLSPQGDCEATEAHFEALLATLSPALTAFAASEGSPLREAALRLLSRSPAASGGALVDALWAREDAERMGLLERLPAGHVPPQLRPALLDVARTAPRWSARRDAVRALGSPRDDVSLDAFERLLIGERSPVVRLSLVSELAKAPSARARGLLRRAARDPEPAVAEAAELALGKTGLADSPALSHPGCIPAN